MIVLLYFLLEKNSLCYDMIWYYMVWYVMLMWNWRDIHEFDHFSIFFFISGSDFLLGILGYLGFDVYCMAFANITTHTLIVIFGWFRYLPPIRKTGPILIFKSQIFHKGIFKHPNPQIILYRFQTFGMMPNIQRRQY